MDARHLISIFNFIPFNFYRHMKIHDKGPNGVPASHPVSPSKRRKPTKRKLSVEDDGEKTNEPPNKKVLQNGLVVCFCGGLDLTFESKIKPLNLLC